MAEHKVQGGSMLLFIDPNGGTDYEMVVCLTSVGKSDSVSVVDASSACGPDKSPGTLEISYTFEGQHLQDPTTGKISGTDLRSLLRSETTIGWMIAPENPEEGDEIEEGIGYLSELSSTYAFDSVGTFTGTIQPYGTPTITIEGGGGFAIGDAYQGGIIAWLDGTGVHGILITGAQTSFGTILPDFTVTPWSTPNNNVTGATGSAWGSGTANNAAIIANTTTSLALDCAGLTSGGNNDWVLPSKDDLANIFSNGVALNLASYICHSSTEIDATTCYQVEFANPGVNFYTNTGNKAYNSQCFAVRYF